MTIHLHDTLQGKKVPFEPQNAGEVTMYLCGPTVYNYAHIGNARPAVVFDLLARVLRRRYKLTFARNITDVDDKINARAAEEGVPITEVTARTTAAFHKDIEELNALDVADKPTGATTEQERGWKGKLPRMVVVSSEGKKIGSVEGKVSPTRLYSVLKKGAQAEFTVKLDSLVKQHRDLLNQIDKLDGRKKVLAGKETRANGKETGDIRKLRREIELTEAKLQKQEKNIFDVKRKDKKA